MRRDHAAMLSSDGLWDGFLGVKIARSPYVESAESPGSDHVRAPGWVVTESSAVCWVRTSWISDMGNNSVIV